MKNLAAGFRVFTWFLYNVIFCIWGALRWIWNMDWLFVIKERKLPTIHFTIAKVCIKFCDAIWSCTTVQFTGDLNSLHCIVSSTFLRSICFCLANTCIFSYGNAFFHFKILTFLVLKILRSYVKSHERKSRRGFFILWKYTAYGSETAVYVPVHLK